MILSLRKFSKFLRLLWHPVFRTGLLAGVAATIEHDGAFSGLEFATILDVGANRGQFLLLCLSKWPRSLTHCFEPIPGEGAYLSRIKRQVRGSRVLLHAFALGDRSRSADLHLGSRLDSSSILALGPSQEEVFGVHEVGTLRIDVKRLDECGIAIVAPALLKIDAQGFEYEILVGAGATLDLFDYIYVEVSNISFYENQRHADEVEQYIVDRGFSLVANFNELKNKAGAVVQKDVLFRRQVLQERIDRSLTSAV